VVIMLLLPEVTEFKLLVGTLPGGGPGGPLLAGLGVPTLPGPPLPPLPLPGTLPGPLGPLF